MDVDAGMDADGEAKSEHKKSRHILAERQNLGQKIKKWAIKEAG